MIVEELIALWKFTKTTKLHWLSWIDDRVHAWVLCNAKWAIFHIYYVKNKLHLMRWWWFIIVNYFVLDKKQG